MLAFWALSLRLFISTITAGDCFIFNVLLLVVFFKNLCHIGKIGNVIIKFVLIRAVLFMLITLSIKFLFK